MLTIREIASADALLIAMKRSLIARTAHVVERQYAAQSWGVCCCTVLQHACMYAVRDLVVLHSTNCICPPNEQSDISCCITSCNKYVRQANGFLFHVFARLRVGQDVVLSLYQWCIGYSGLKESIVEPLFLHSLSVVWEVLQQPLLRLCVNMCSSEQQQMVLIHCMQQQLLLLGG